MSNTIERLNKLLGYDPVKGPNASSAIVKEVLDELNAERAAAAKEEVKKALTEAVKIRTEWEAKRREFQKLDQKFEKELGKVIGRIEALSSGKSPEEANAEAKEKESEEKPAENAV